MEKNLEHWEDIEEEFSPPKEEIELGPNAIIVDIGYEYPNNSNIFHKQSQNPNQIKKENALSIDGVIKGNNILFIFRTTHNFWGKYKEGK